MKLLVDCHVFDSNYSGVRTYLQGIYSYIIKYKDIDFYFAASDIVNLKRIFGEAENIHYVSLKYRNGLWRYLFEYERIIKKYSIDYAHFQYVSPLRKRCREIVTLHDLLFLDFPQFFPFLYRLKRKYLFFRSAKRADLLFTVSNFSMNEILHFFKINKKKIYLTPNAVLPYNGDGNRIDVKSKYGLDKYILTVSRIEPRKNHYAILKSFVDLKLYTDGYKLVVVGRMDFADKKFVNLYNSLEQDIKSNILFLAASFPELVELYKNASLFVFASYAEGFGIPPLEAITYGCPLLCSNATALSDFDFPKDWTFDPYDEDDLKLKMKKLLNNRPNLDSEFFRLSNIYSWERIADNIYVILKNDFK